MPPQRDEEARAWASLIDPPTISLLCNSVDAVIGPTIDTLDIAGPASADPVVCMVQGRGGSAVALTVSAGMIWRYVQLQYPSISRLVVVQGVSAGSAAAVIAANRRLFAGCEAPGQSVRSRPHVSIYFAFQWSDE